MSAPLTDGAWFAPKMFGYGAGWPIAWQGWALLGAYTAAMLALNFTLARDHTGTCVAVSLIATAALCVIAARHTRGGWRWRWGPDT